jgi:hypothetical protein
LYEIIIPKDSDWDIMNELGHLSTLQFVDLNKGEVGHQLRYITESKRAEETERLIKYYKFLLT